MLNSDREIGRQSGMVGSLFIIAALFLNHGGIIDPYELDLASFIIGLGILSLGIAGLFFSYKNYVRGLLYLSLLPASFAFYQYATSKLTMLEILVHIGPHWFLMYSGAIIQFVSGSLTFIKPKELAGEIDGGASGKIDKNLGKLAALLIIISIYVPYIHLYDAETRLHGSQTGYMQLTLALIALYLSFANRLGHLLWIGIISLLIHMRTSDLYIAYGGKTWTAHISTYDNKPWAATTWWEYGYYLSACGPIIMILIGLCAQLCTTSGTLLKKLKELALR